VEYAHEGGQTMKYDAASAFEGPAQPVVIEVL
jgi:hypothetical protein